MLQRTIRFPATYGSVVSSLVAAALTALLSASLIHASYLKARGSKLYNDKGEVVRLTGVNWFGFETSNLGPHGLWARDYHGILIQIKNMGFNCIRIPFCNTMLRDGAKVSSISMYGEDPYYPREKTLLNKELDGFTPLQIMDEIIRYAGVLGLVVILDNHSREPDGYMEEKLWYTNVTSEKQWIDDWVLLAARYKNNPTVAGFDLNNEPHGKIKDGGAAWGSGDPSKDWNSAAQKCGNAILSVNPDALIIIEGVEQAGETMYWWGGNLRGVRTAPIVLSNPEKLVYSPHEYGPEVFQQPWFFESEFPNNMRTIWHDAFGFIAHDAIAPLLVGEFGIKDMKSYGNKAGIWFTAFLKYMADNFFSWTFWCFNPNSGDTGGMLSYDWITVEQWKLDAIKPWLAPFINEPQSVYFHATARHDTPRHITVHSTRLTRAAGLTGTSILGIAALNGRIIRSSRSSSLSLQHLSSGAYIALLFNNGSMVETVRFHYTAR